LDRNTYRASDQFGVWEATVDALAYSQGGRTMVAGKGKWFGIHLFVQTAEGERFWLYVI